MSIIWEDFLEKGLRLIQSEIEVGKSKGGGRVCVWMCAARIGCKTKPSQVAKEDEMHPHICPDL